MSHEDGEEHWTDSPEDAKDCIVGVIIGLLFVLGVIVVITLIYVTYEALGVT